MLNIALGLRMSSVRGSFAAASAMMPHIDVSSLHNLLTLGQGKRRP
jgi:hypothetical protein